MEAVNIACSFFAAASLHKAQKAEAEWHKEESPLPASYAQIGLMMIVISQLSRYCKLQNEKPISTPVTILAAVAPLGIGYGADNKEIIAHTAFQSVNRHLGGTLTVLYWLYIFATFRLKKYWDVAAAISGYAFSVLIDRTPADTQEKTNALMIAYQRLNDVLFEESYFTRFLGGAKCLTYGETYYGPYLYGNFAPQGIQSGVAIPYEGIEGAQTAVDSTHLGVRPKPWGQPEYRLLIRFHDVREVVENLEANKTSMNEGIYHEMRAILEKIAPKLTEKVKPRLKALETASMAAFTKELPKIYEELFQKELTPRDALYFLLYRKQDEFLDQVFVEDYEGKPDWFRKLFAEGTPQQINIYRLFYGEPIGMNLDYAKSDVTQSPESNPFSRLIWRPWVESTSRNFYQTFYTEEKIIQWVLDPSFSTLPKVKEWFNQRNIDNVDANAARFFLLQHGVLGSVANVPIFKN